MLLYLVDIQAGVAIVNRGQHGRHFIRSVCVCAAGIVLGVCTSAVLSSCLLTSYLPDVAKTSVLLLIWITHSDSHIDGRITTEVTVYPFLHSTVEALGAILFRILLHITGTTI